VGTTEQSTRGKWIRLFGLAALGVILIIGALSSFPVIEYRGNRIRMFAPDRLLGRMPATIRGITRPQENVRGWVLGDERILETEHGQIVLKNRPYISAISNTVAVIDVDNFRQGRASHNLVVGGMEIPPYVSIIFSDSRVAFRPWISSILLDGQEMIVSNISINISNIFIDPPRFTADIRMGFWGPEYITLADNVQLRSRDGRFLNMYKNDERWVITGRTFVRLPGEIGFTEYRSVTFEPNWGAFIEGEPR